jgi:hypothetical protein
MAAAGDHDDLLARPRQVGAQEAAGRPGADDREPHRSLNDSATVRRWILPVAVRGILSTM